MKHYNQQLQSIPDERMDSTEDARVWAEKQAGQSDDEAYSRASFASAMQPEAASSVEKGLLSLEHAISRQPMSIAPGGHLTLPSIDIVNFTDSPWRIAAEECERILIHSASEKLTLVIDDTCNAERSENTLRWTVNPLDPEYAWEQLQSVLHFDDEQPLWFQALSDQRFPVAEDLGNEHNLRTKRIATLLQDVFTSFSYGPTQSQMRSVEQSDVVDIMMKLDYWFNHYTKHPRVAIACKSIDDWTPAASWQRAGTQALKASLAMMTGDDPLFNATIAAAGDNIRSGTLVFTGDPDNVGDDLLSATLPSASCALVLKPHVLQQCIFLGGLPHINAQLPIPHRLSSMYNTVATNTHVQELLKTLVYLGISPAVPEHAAAYIQGRESEIGMADVTPDSPFAVLMNGLHSKYDEEGGDEALSEAVRNAVGVCLHRSLGLNPSLSAIGAVYCGSLSLDDIETVVVPLRSSEDFSYYERAREYPQYMRRSAELLRSQGIHVRVRQPLLMEL